MKCLILRPALSCPRGAIGIGRISGKGEDEYHSINDVLADLELNLEEYLKDCIKSRKQVVSLSK